VYSPYDLSDDSSWDSELDGPDSLDSDLESSEDEKPRFYDQGAHNQRGRYYIEEEEDEFERDPWNAVCVVGLRVLAKDTDVTIEVQNGDGKRKEGDDASVTSGVVTRKGRELDVDDSAADATSPLRTRGNLESALALREKISKMGDAPAGIERDGSGTLS